MKIDEVKEVTISEFFKMCENDDGIYQIDTPDGWQDINFLVKKENKECYVLRTENNLELGCSDTHNIYTENGWKQSVDIDVQKDRVKTKNGFENIVSKEYIGIRDTYDIGINSDEHSYYTNDIVSHNCGKSMTSKAIASAWQMPLLRLDMGKLFNSLVGKSEARTREALKLCEKVSPAILWVDEIEKALAGVQSSGRTDGGTTSRVLSTFLTWMQEKKAPVFVVATANNHESIPPEFLRAGRFDEIFFVDLPNNDEREEIFDILLRKKGLNPKDFNISKLVNKTNNFSGAEIEKTIDSAMLIGFHDKRRKLKTEDIELAASKVKSLFEMRQGDFADIREWANEKCVMANTDASAKKAHLNLDGDKDAPITIE